MDLNEKQLEMCETSMWDFSDLKALFLAQLWMTRLSVI